MSKVLLFKRSICGCIRTLVYCLYAFIGKHTVNHISYKDYMDFLIYTADWPIVAKYIAFGIFIHSKLTKFGQRTMRTNE